MKALGCACVLGIACDALAQSEPQRYPTKPIRLISAFAPGGGSDRVARMLAPDLTEAWGQSVVIDNRPGAGGAGGPGGGGNANRGGGRP